MKNKQSNITRSIFSSMTTCSFCGVKFFEKMNGIYNKSLIKNYDNFGRNITYPLDNSAKVVYIYDVAISKINAMSTFNTNFGFNSMNNNNLQSKITYQCAVNKTSVVANGNSLNSSTSNTLNNSITATSNLPPNSSILTENIASLNPFKFSSKYHNSTLGLVYYNYRHYNPNDGRWFSRDPIAEKGGYNLYGMVKNNLISFCDFNGNGIVDIWNELIEDIADTVTTKIEKAKNNYKMTKAYLDASIELLYMYLEMRKRNLKNSDKYFHCMGMCNATRRSNNSDIVLDLAILRETFDILKNDFIDKLTDEEQYIDSFNDMIANNIGINCPKYMTCECCCKKYRVNGL